jgi:hypothetical protein
VPFGTAKFSPVKNARYWDWEDAFDVEFDDGLSFLEPHKTIRRANKISPKAVPVRVSVPKKFRTHFKIEYDNGKSPKFPGHSSVNCRRRIRRDNAKTFFRGLRVESSLSLPR